MIWWCIKLKELILTNSRAYIEISVRIPIRLFVFILVYNLRLSINNTSGVSSNTRHNITYRPLSSALYTTYSCGWGTACHHGSAAGVQYVMHRWHRDQLYAHYSMFMSASSLTVRTTAERVRESDYFTPKHDLSSQH